MADVDSTEEMQVLTADYAAEYGRAAGGQIRIVTKGGSATFHGGAYEYFRNSDMNANTWTRNQSTTTNFASPFRYNQFGFNVGGPVFISPGHSQPHRQEVFFFVGEEWVALPQRADADAGSAHRADARRAISANCSAPNIFYSKPTDHLRSDHLPLGRRGQLHAVPEQHHSHQPAEQQRHRRF